jgi:conjugative transfer ATPase
MSVLQKILHNKTLGKRDKQLPIADDNNLSIINSSSFTDLLPVKQYSNNGIFYFRDLQNAGAMFSFKAIALDNKSKEDKEGLLHDINFILQQTIPSEYENPWITQIFATKTNNKDQILQSVKKFSKNKTKFNNSWNKVLEEHLSSLSNKDGAFVDKNTNIKFSLSQLETTVCLWQEINQQIKIDVEKQIKRVEEVLNKLESAFEQINIKIQKYNANDYINNITSFFHEDKVNYQPNYLQLLEDDITQIALNRIKINYTKNTFSFTSTDQNNSQTKYYAFLPLERINSELALGHITGEQKNNIAILDKLPMCSTWSQTTIHLHQDKINEQLEKIKNRSLGTDDNTQLNKQKIANALKEIATQNNAIYRFAGGVYISSDNFNDLDAKIRDIKTNFGIKGIELLTPSQNLTMQQDFISNLPFSFNYEQDKKYYRKRTILQDCSSIAKLSPFVGRNTGTGSSGLIKFNRGGEALMFDPLQDKENNGFGLLFGPSGSGKSSFLIEHMFDMLKHNPFRIFILEKGNSFGLAVDHLGANGYSMHKVSIKPNSENITMPPFADAIRVLNESKKDDKSESRDIVEELSFTAQLMITNGVKKELDEFRQRDLFTIAKAIKLAAQNTVASGREITLTEDVANALDELAKDDDLTTAENERIRSMAQSMRAFISSNFANKVFNQEGNLFPEVDITHLDVGYLGNPNQESKLLIAFMALMSEINSLAEENEKSGRPIFLYIDEAHLFTKHPVIIKYLLSMIKMYRKWNVWVWLGTPSLDDYTQEASGLFGTVEWKIVLQASKDEIEKFSTLVNITKQQKEMLLSMKGSKRQYKEGCVISPNITTLFRSIPTSLVLALAMTESDEKAQRQKIMQECNCTELEAAYKMADKISKARSEIGV